ncbi:MAG: DUF4349 domain-containing protein [Bacillaceae bacterium]|nr:DUF4349 domain-containing protein [Bacillaceae bacterium]
MIHYVVRHFRPVFLFFVIVILTLTGCSSGQQSAPTANDQGAVSSDYAVKGHDEAVEEGTASSSGNTNAVTGVGIGSPQDRMVIYTARITAEVLDYEQSRNQIEELLNQYGGYIVNSSEYQNEHERGGNLTFRIPQGGFESFMGKVKEMSLSFNSTTDGQDVTEEYVDLESRLKAKQAVESRLLEFMNQAEKVEDLLKISENLGRVQEEIEQIKGRMQYLENHSAYSTIHIQLIEKETKVEAPDSGTLQSAWYAFIRSTDTLISFLTGAFVLLIGSLPYLIFFAIIAPIFWFIMRKLKRKRYSPDPFDTVNNRKHIRDSESDDENNPS